MPTYDYECPCGEVFEIFELMSKVKRTLPCPKCGKTAKRQIAGGSPPLLRGSDGFMPYRGS